MTILESARLQLVPFGPDDEVLLHTIFTDPFVRKYLWDDEVIGPEVTRDILAANEQHFRTDGWGLWQVRLEETGDPIGFAGLWRFFEEGQPQLLYGLFEKYAGRGYATEAAAAVIQYAFTQLGFSYLTAAMDEPHTASHKVAERLGMRFTGKRRENGKPTVFYKIEAPGLR